MESFSRALHASKTRSRCRTALGCREVKEQRTRDDVHQMEKGKYDVSGLGSTQQQDERGKRRSGNVTHTLMEKR